MMDSSPWKVRLTAPAKSAWQYRLPAVPGHLPSTFGQPLSSHIGAKLTRYSRNTFFFLSFFGVISEYWATWAATKVSRLARNPKSRQLSFSVSISGYQFLVHSKGKWIFQTGPQSVRSQWKKIPYTIMNKELEQTFSQKCVLSVWDNVSFRKTILSAGGRSE